MLNQCVCSIEETSPQDSLVILRRSIQYYLTILKKCSTTDSDLQPTLHVYKAHMVLPWYVHALACT